MRIEKVLGEDSGCEKAAPSAYPFRAAQLNCISRAVANKVGCFLFQEYHLPPGEHGTERVQEAPRIQHAFVRQIHRPQWPPVLVGLQAINDIRIDLFITLIASLERSNHGIKVL